MGGTAITRQGRVERFLQAHASAYAAGIAVSPATGVLTSDAAGRPNTIVMQVAIVLAGGRPIMAVTPECGTIDLEKVAATVGAPSAQFADAATCLRIFPDCEPGGIPPFGNLYGLPVYVDAAFVRWSEVMFWSGDRQRYFAMKYQDYARLVHPVLADLVIGTLAPCTS